MKNTIVCCILLVVATTASAVNEVSISTPQLELVADFGWGHQPTGVAVTSNGRQFVSFPRWFTNFTGPSVAEVKDGLVFPYPNKDLNSWKAGEDGSTKFVCVQSVFVDHMDQLYISLHLH